MKILQDGVAFVKDEVFVDDEWDLHTCRRASETNATEEVIVLCRGG
jgi:hypothetical protein